MTQVIEHLLTRKTLVWSLLAATLTLSACGDRDQIILQGQREGLRDILEEPDEPELRENQTLPLVLAAAQSNANWSQFWGSPAVRTAHPALSGAPQLAWSSNIGDGNSRKQRISADPVIGGGLIYTLDAAAQVSATSPDGQTAWVQNLAPPNDDANEGTGGGVAYADGMVFVGLGFGTLTALNAENGEILWTQDLEATASGAPSVAGDLVYISSGDDTGWALNKDTGRVQWQVGGATSTANVLGAPPPVLTSDLAIFSFGSGDIQAVFRRGGLRRWGANVVGERRGFALSKIGDITAAPVVDGSRIYVGNQSGRVVALSAGSGSRLWTAQEGAAGPIWPAGDSVFFVTDQNELVRLSAEDGSRIWGVKLTKFVSNRLRKRSEIVAHFGPIIAGGNVIVASSNGTLSSFDPADGRLTASTDIPSGAASAPAIAGSTLYVVNQQGNLLAYR